MDVLEECFYLGEFLAEVSRHAEIGGRETVKVFEHACCSTRSRDEFEDFLVFAECAVLFFIAGDFLVGEAADAVVVGCRCSI